MRGDHEVSIFGTKYQVKAQLERIDSYSGHADYGELLKYLAGQDPQKVKKIFIGHGEDDSRTGFANHLAKAGFNKSYIPTAKDIIEI